MKTQRRYTFNAALAAILLLGGSAMAQAATPLSAQASNPNTMGWMQGSPPPAGKTIRFTDPDYFAFPKLAGRSATSAS